MRSMQKIWIGLRAHDPGLIHNGGLNQGDIVPVTGHPGGNLHPGQVLEFGCAHVHIEKVNLLGKAEALTGR